MGFYSEISNSKQAAENTAIYNRMNGLDVHSPIGYTLAAAAPQLLSFTTSLIGNILNGSEKDENAKGSVSESAQREQLKKDINKILRDIGAKDENGINEAVNEAQNERDTKIKAAQSELEPYMNGTDKYSQEIKNLQAQIVTGEELTPDQAANNTKIQNRITKLEAERKEVQEKIQANIEKVTETETARVQKIYDKAQEVIKLLQQLADLNCIKEEDKDKPIEEKTETLAEFTKNRDILIDKNINIQERAEAAEKLEEIAQNNPNDATIAKAYAMIKNQVETTLEDEMSFRAQRSIARHNANNNDPMNRFFNNGVINKETPVRIRQFGL